MISDMIGFPDRRNKMIYDSIGIFFDRDCFIVTYKNGSAVVFARQCKTFLEVIHEISTLDVVNQLTFSCSCSCEISPEVKKR